MDSTPCKSFQRDDLEITRNPFDSRELDKENLPAFSPSIFVASACRSSEKVRIFLAVLFLMYYCLYLDSTGLNDEYKCNQHCKMTNKYHHKSIDHSSL